MFHRFRDKSLCNLYVIPNGRSSFDAADYRRRKHNQIGTDEMKATFPIMMEKGVYFGSW